MDDLGTLCLLGLFVIIGLMLLPRLLGGFGGSPYGRRGSEYPRYDDPDIESRGGFGGDAGEGPQYDDPNIRSRGSFGRSGGGSLFGRRGSSPSGGRRVDSPNIRSRGGFGRSK